MRLNKLTPIITHTTMKNHDEKLKSFHQLIHRLSFSLFAPFCYRKNAQIPQINVHNMLIPSPYLLFFSRSVVSIALRRYASCIMQIQKEKTKERKKLNKSILLLFIKSHCFLCIFHSHSQMAALKKNSFTHSLYVLSHYAKRIDKKKNGTKYQKIL